MASSTPAFSIALVSPAGNPEPFAASAYRGRTCLRLYYVTWTALYGGLKEIERYFSTIGGATSQLVSSGKMFIHNGTAGQVT